MAVRTLIGLVVTALPAAVSPAAAIGEFWAIMKEPVTIGGVEVPADSLLHRDKVSAQTKPETAGMP